MKKQFIALFLVFALLISFPLVGVSAEDSEAQGLYGVALGDSVAAFYGLEEAKGYVAQLSAILTGVGVENEFANLAVSGYDTQALLAQLEDEDVLAQLADADIITLNIGGNNILIPLIEVIKKDLAALNITDISKASPAVMMAFATKKLSEEQITVLQEGVSLFAEDFPAIIETLRTAAPNAKIFANTVYNPIPSILGMYEAAETLISLINGVITENAEKGGYTAVDVYSVYKASTSVITNFDTTSGSFDIHPNAEGHVLIAKAVANAIAGTAAESSEEAANASTEALTRGRVIAEIIDMTTSLLPDIDDSKIDANAAELFSDVPPEHEYFEAIMTAKALGIVRGVGNSKFNVDDPMTREDFVIIILRIVGLMTNVDMAEAVTAENLAKLEAIATDFAEVSSYAKEAVATAISLGILEIEDGNINPSESLSYDFITPIIENILSIIMASLSQS